jgi:hypothetical protein
MVHENPKRVAKLYIRDKKYCVKSDTQNVGQTNSGVRPHNNTRKTVITYQYTSAKDLVFEVQPNGMFISVH